MLAAVIKAENAKDALNVIKKAEGSDLAELRFDYAKNLDFESKFLYDFISAAKSRNKPIIITNRTKEEGGAFCGSEDERMAILKKAIELGADYIDIECSADKSSIKNLISSKKNTKVIVSYHNFNETPNNLKGVYSDIKKLNPDMIKIATSANSVADNFGVFELIKFANREKRKIIAFCMGSYGQFSRILSIILGSQVTYASIENGKESAAGQFTIGEMNGVYRISKLNKNTKIAGLIGNPVEHSWSHVIHNAAFGKTGINAAYMKFRVDNLEEFIRYFRKLNILGFSVTIPHKVEVIKCLDGIDEKAKAIGAVNTIAVKNKKLFGYNTDCYGAVEALKAKTRLKGKDAVILGAGGSARALAYGLVENGANVTILNRTLKNAKTIADDFGCGYGTLEDLSRIDYDILINTTPVGMHPYVNHSPIPSSLVRKNTIVFDIVFNPLKTKLIREAERKGCVAISGFEMLIRGAALQFKLWTGKDAPEKLMRKKVLDYVKN